MPFTIIWVGICFLALIAAIMLIIILVRKKRSDSEENCKTVSLNIPVENWQVKSTELSVGNAQDIGRRDEQQDSFGLSDISDSKLLSEKGVLAVLADGMGGLRSGAQISKVAVQSALLSFREEAPEKDNSSTLLRILRRTVDSVKKLGISDGGTTFIGAIIQNDQLHFVSVGDSRIYLMRNGGLIQLNREHIYGRELDDLWMNGELTKEAAYGDKQRKALTSYVGKQGDILIDRNINPIMLYSGDKVVLMSDGVFGYIPEREMEELLRKTPMEAAESVRKAVLAKQNPFQDNLTIIIIGK